MSTSQIPDLWSSSISPVVATPLALLRSQAVQLSNHTGGIVRADVVTASAKGSSREHCLVISAPALDFKQEIVKVVHDVPIVYPCSVYAEEFEDDSREPYWVASSPESVISALGQVLQSDRIVALINSLVAVSNEEEPTDSAVK
ncbi:MAG: hypothetical protein C0478_08685 [Planctomyces sp.]|nr:hypothetical protein [Planctomyces sp.]